MEINRLNARLSIRLRFRDAVEENAYSADAAIGSAAEPADRYSHVMIAVAVLEKETGDHSQYIIHRGFFLKLELCIVDAFYGIGNVDDFPVCAGSGNHRLIDLILNGILWRNLPGCLTLQRGSGKETTHRCQEYTLKLSVHCVSERKWDHGHTTTSRRWRAV